MSVFGNVDLSGLPGDEELEAHLTFDPVLEVEIIVGQVVMQMPGEVVFTATADELGQSPVDFQFDTSKGLGQQEVRLSIIVLEKSF